MYGEGKYCPQGKDRCSTVRQGRQGLQEPRPAGRNHRHQPQLRRAHRGLGGLALHRAADAPQVHSASRSSPTRARASWASRTSACCGARVTTCRRRISRRRPRASTGRSSRCTKSLHCYARGKLARKVRQGQGAGRQAHPGALVRQHVGAAVEPRVRRPAEALSAAPASRAPTASCRRRSGTRCSMTKSAESFYTSIGFPALPQTFWERSMLTRPRDREVVCHASAWDMDDKDDVRIKMCMKPIEEDLFTIYHELGHVYYYIWYKDQPAAVPGRRARRLPRSHRRRGQSLGDARLPAPDRPGERGEALAGSRHQPADEDGARQDRLPAVRQAHRRMALGGVRRPHQAGRVQQGLVGTARRNTRACRRRWRAREEDFDPGAKYHIPGNTSYTRYFLSFILQFQFHKALCDAAGFKGPLHECSIFGSKEAGEKYAAMLKLGASQPWPDTLEKLTGTRADGRVGDHRLLQAARRLAGRAEQGPELRLGFSRR